MATDREFHDELPEGIDLSPSRRYELLVADVIEHPGKWSRVNEDGVVTGARATALCSAIRRGGIKAFDAEHNPPGQFEAERVKVGRDEPAGEDQYDVYVRWLPAEVGK